MKTLLACSVFAAIGMAIGWNVNFNRYGQYKPFFGPMDYRGEVTATNAVASISQSWDAASPKVEVIGGTSHDFGVMEPNEEGEHVFLVKNIGDADLSLRVGASTCKCTVGELGKETLPPGEQTEVRMSWTVKTNESSFGQSAELRTNDPSKVAIRFEIKGKVVREVQVSPEEVTFGEVAAGENIEFEVRVFSFLDEKVSPGEAKFQDEEIRELTEVQVEEFKPSAEDGLNEGARQGFLVSAKINPGLKQGPVNQNISLELLPEGAGGEVDDADKKFVYIPVTGRIVGALSMLPNSKLRGVSGGGYIFDFGKIGPQDSLTAKSFVSLKGQQKDATELSIGEISPAEHIEAELADPIGRGQMALYGLTLKLKPGSEKVERLGMNKDDYGYVIIESNNPKVPPMKLRLKFSLSAR